MCLCGKKPSVNRMHITIRKATVADFPAIVDLIREFATFQKTPERVSITAAQLKADQDLYQCFVAENENHQIIGYASCYFAYYIWSGKNLYLDDLYVKESARGHSLGTRLLQTVIDHAKATNCVKVRWQVSRWNTAAIDFYKKMGAWVDDVELNCHLELT
jgi:diamine N-acetyltransferase